MYEFLSSPAFSTHTCLNTTRPSLFPGVHSEGYESRSPRGTRAGRRYYQRSVSMMLLFFERIPDQSLWFIQVSNLNGSTSK
jgi:hypothetical protein